MDMEVKVLEGYRLRIVEIREGLGLSQNRLAKASGLTQSYLSKVESGRRTPSLSSLVRLCRELGCGLGDLVKLTD